MGTAKKWSNVSVAMQSALGAAKTITDIAQGATATVTATHDFSAGDYVVFDVEGMHQLDGRVFRVLSVSTTVSFVIEDTDGTSLDTSDFDAFTSGTCQKVTFGTTIVTATTINAGGGDFEFIDTTTIHDNTRNQIPGLAQASTFTMDHIWDPSDSGLIALKAAYDSQAQRAFKFTFGAGGAIMVFNGYVGANLLPGGQAQGLVTTPAAITMFGSPSYYAS